LKFFKAIHQSPVNLLYNRRRRWKRRKRKKIKRTRGRRKRRRIPSLLTPKVLGVYNLKTIPIESKVNCAKLGLLLVLLIVRSCS
jgi:hypothetical protein